MPRRTRPAVKHSPPYKPKSRKRPRRWHRVPAAGRDFLAAVRAAFREAA